MDAVLLARIQFAMTIGFHFLFPPISIGLAWLLVIIEGIGWRRGDEAYVRLGRFFGKVFALTFALGVATGIVMEFQFGTNWAEYSKFVGDIFGSALAAEGIFAFFLESGFLGLYLFGRDKVSKAVHWFSILMVAVGATMSAFWILVANSWQQTPAGYVIRNGRAELANFYEAVFNPSTVVRFLHTVDACLIAGAFMAAGISAYLLLRKGGSAQARKSLKIALIIGFISSVFAVVPTGDWHARQVAATQPAKFAALEGLYESREGAPLVVFGVPDPGTGEIKAKVEIPKLLSLMAFGDLNARVTGLDEFPEDEIPPVWITFVSFHTMVMFGGFFVLSTAFGLFLLWRKKLFDTRWFLHLLVVSIPLPLAAIQFGWAVAEVGRQPWIVYGLLKTADAVSTNVPAGNILATIILFALIYILLGALYIYILVRIVNQGIEPAAGKEVTE